MTYFYLLSQKIGKRNFEIVGRKNEENKYELRLDLLSH